VTDLQQLTIGIPCHDGFKAEMVLSLLHALAGFPHSVHFAVHKGCYLHANREAIVQEAIAAGSTHLMFLDTDIVFPPDGIQKLLAHGKAIVGGAYNVKALPPVSTIKLADANGDFVNTSGASLPREPFPCAAVPTGFMCLDLTALLASGLPAPYFTFGTYKGQLMGEDVHFCQRARAAGLEIWCDPTIALGHVGDYLY
jgi:hypothetical protein